MCLAHRLDFPVDYYQDSYHDVDQFLLNYQELQDYWTEIEDLQELTKHPIFLKL